MEILFLGCETSDDQSREQIPVPEAGREDGEKIIAWTIKSFKSRGPITIMLQKVAKIIQDVLVNIFSGCLISGYTPEKWREVKTCLFTKSW